MSGLRQCFNRRLTPVESVLVVLLVGFIGAVGYFLYNFTVARILEARVNAALPKVCDAIRRQRGSILNAIEAYKAQFGEYPPDHVVRRNPLSVDPVTNTLLYELSGTLYRPAGKEFQVAGLEPAEAAYVTNFFQCERFKNCSEKQEQLKNFLTKQDTASRQLHDDPDVFVLGFNVGAADVSDDLFWQIDEKVGSWRYVRSSPTNNPGKFDLWIEIKTKHRATIIGNWKAAE
jgi:hypothetical protein